MAIREILKTQYSFRFVLFLTINCDLHILLKFKEKKKEKRKKKKKVWVARLGLVWAYKIIWEGKSKGGSAICIMDCARNGYLVHI